MPIQHRLYATVWRSCSTAAKAGNLECNAVDSPRAALSGLKAPQPSSPPPTEQRQARQTLSPSRSLGTGLSTARLRRKPRSPALSEHASHPDQMPFTSSPNSTDLWLQSNRDRTIPNPQPSPKASPQFSAAWDAAFCETNPIRGRLIQATRSKKTNTGFLPFRPPARQASPQPNRLFGVALNKAGKSASDGVILR